MSAGRIPKNNILAGIFLLVGLTLAVVMVFFISGISREWGAKHKYVVSFSLTDGAEGLDRGSPVKVGGQKVGKVSKTAFTYDPISGEPDGIDVTIELPKTIRLYQDASAQLLRPLLGSSSTINISAVPGPGSASDFVGPPGILPPGGRLQGRLGAPGFIAPADYARFQDILARIDRVTAEVEPRIPIIMDDAQAIVADARAISGDARAQWQEWGSDITNVLDRAEQQSQRFDGIVTNFEEGVASAESAIKKVEARVDANSGSFDEIVENVRELTRKAKGEAYDQVMAAIATGREGLDSFTGAARRADELLARKTPDIEAIVTSGAIAAQQLKLLTVELRSSPWRLLYQPTKKELENELLYNSVRQYSAAVTELRSAAEAINAMTALAAAGNSTLDAAAVADMQQKLQAAFTQYQEEERKFLDRWVKAK